MNPQKNLSLEAYLVFSQPVPQQALENPLPSCQLEAYPENLTHIRAIRVFGDTEANFALKTLRQLLESGTVRWLELGLRGYALMQGKREYRPWRKNVHLSRDAFLLLAALEPEVRYHAPV